MLRLILITLSLMTAGAAQASNFNATVSAGYRALDAGRWAPAERQFNVGLFSDVGFVSGIPLFASGSIQVSDASGTRCPEGCDTPEGQLSAIRSDVAIQEVTLGLKYMPRFGGLSFYVGGGGSYLKVDVRAADGFRRVRDNDSGAGVYAHAGTLWHLGLWQVGVEVRQLSGSRVKLFGESADVDGTVVSILIGADWGD